MTKYQPKYIREAADIRRLAADRATTWSYGDFILRSGLTHAQEEMAHDEISEPDIRYALRNCFVIGLEIHPNGEWRYTCIGKNVDAISITCIVLYSLDPKRIEIRTVWVS